MTTGTKCSTTAGTLVAGKVIADLLPHKTARWHPHREVLRCQASKDICFDAALPHLLHGTLKERHQLHLNGSVASSGTRADWAQRSNIMVQAYYSAMTAPINERTVIAEKGKGRTTHGNDGPRLTSFIRNH